MWKIFVAIFFVNVVSSEPIRHPVIIGGMEAKIQDVPYQVALYHYGIFKCGGSILSEWYILTAAHCLDFAFLPTDAVTFRAGSANNRDGGVIVQAENITIHPEYDAETFNNDVAIVKLKEPLELNNENIKAIRIVDEDFTIKNFEMVQVSGWGRLETGYLPEQLMRVIVPVLHHRECNIFYKPLHDSDILETMICAGFPETDSCDGDSGGPLVYPLDNELVQLGIVSFGPNTCGVSVGVYTYISHPSVREFIRSTSDI
ncbi:mite allergen Der p 3-like [Culicoides brevitarsis]|uniref:mite allergen Der p 3-like n=1 Tax=Culicoides brevitarsis TaxID=469753 RepID=UPI00307BD913